MIRLVHVAPGLEVGGAQMILSRLALALEGDGFRQEVVSLTRLGPVGRKLREAGIPVEALGMRPGVADPRGLVRLYRSLRSRRPDLVQTWMYHSDLMGGLVGRRAGVPRIVWGLHHGRLDGTATWHMRLSARLCARLSPRLPDRIVCVSDSARAWHAGIGYDLERIVVVQNGFDTAVFRPDPEARRDVRRELRLASQNLVVGLVARFDPVKGHRTFLSAAASVVRAVPEATFLLCGEGIDASNPYLARWARASGVGERILFLGRRDDVERIMAALDVLVLPSSAEGFANVVGEGMASGLPCVVSDVADLRHVLGETGRVVPPGEAEALAAAIVSLLELDPAERRALGLAARGRIERDYAQERMVSAYRGLYRELVGSGAR